MSNNKRLGNDEMLEILLLSRNATAIYTSEDIVIEMANEAMLRFWGKDKSIMGKPLMEGVPELQGQPFKEMLQQVLRTGETNAGIVPADTLMDGRLQTRYYDYEYRAIENDQGETYCILHTASDVTDRVMGEQAIAKTKELQASLQKGQELNEELRLTNERLSQSQDRLYHLNSNLEDRVQRRTQALTNSESLMQDLNRELAHSNEELAAGNEELTSINEELIETQHRMLSINLKLRASESRLDQILTQLPAPVVLLGGPNQVVETTNEALLFFWDKKREEVLGKPMLEIFPELTNQPFPALWKHVYETGEPIINREMPVRFNRPTGVRLFYVDYHYQPLRDLNGTITGVLATVIDNTDKVLARQAIQESEERFRLMAEGTGIYIAVGDETGNAVYFNKPWTELTGRSMEDLLRFGWADLVHPEDREEYVDLYLDAFKELQPFTGEFRLLNYAGEYCWLLTHGYPRFLPDGSFAGYISSSVDITERKKDEQRKSDFIAMVSHELKTPLTSMNAYIQLSLMGIGDGNFERRKLLLEKAEKQIGKMTTLINGFLNVSRLESGQIHIERTRFNMAILVKESEEETASLYHSHRIVFAPVEETFVFADRDKIGQVINNLISNAVKYSPVTSLINVACVTVDEMAVVSVKDSGIGITETDKSKIFNRYYRVSNDISKTAAGFGIGLYLCAEIIRRHDGKIWVESEEGEGSAFSFSLPVG